LTNEDAFYKFMAYSGMLEKTRREGPRKALSEPEVVAGFHAFEAYYQDELLEDLKRPARPIDPEAFAPKPFTLSTEAAPEYLDRDGRREKFMSDLKLYNEGKLEQEERRELYFVLEKMFD